MSVFALTAMTIAGKGLAGLYTTGKEGLRSDSFPPVLYQQNLDAFSDIILGL